MEYINISVANQFSKTPGPRLIKEGEFSGELFFNTILDQAFSEALQSGKKIKVDLDGTAGYGTSFLEQTFGGLARKYSAKKVLELIEIKSDEEDYLKKDINEYINAENDVQI